MTSSFFLAGAFRSRRIQRAGTMPRACNENTRAARCASRRPPRLKPRGCRASRRPARRASSGTGRTFPRGGRDPARAGRL